MVEEDSTYWHNGTLYVLPRRAGHAVVPGADENRRDHAQHEYLLRMREEDRFWTMAIPVMFVVGAAMIGVVGLLLA